MTQYGKNKKPRLLHGAIDFGPCVIMQLFGFTSHTVDFQLFYQLFCASLCHSLTTDLLPLQSLGLAGSQLNSAFLTLSLITALGYIP